MELTLGSGERVLLAKEASVALAIGIAAIGLGFVGSIALARLAGPLGQSSGRFHAMLTVIHLSMVLVPFAGFVYLTCCPRRYSSASAWRRDFRLFTVIALLSAFLLIVDFN